MRLSLLVPLLAVLAACEVVPPTVSNVDVDDAAARGLYKTVCKGLEMKDGDIREHATSRLTEVNEPIAQECVCQFGYDAAGNSFDLEILNGLTGTERADLVECFTPGLTNKALEKRTDLIVGLRKTRVDLKSHFLTMAQDASESAEVRVEAIKGLGGSEDTAIIGALSALLTDDAVPEVRAAAAEALVGQKDQPVVDALVSAVTEDADGVVRAAALKTVNKLKLPESDEMVCKAMIEDESPAVRKQAVLSFKGTKRDAAVECLRKKAFTKEEDGSVREALLKVLKSSPSDKVGAVLCDAIPFYMRTYITDASPERVPGTDIAKAQNDRDFENSYDCFSKALRSRRGWSCKGHQYVAAWYREVGGKPHVPRCAGDEGAGEVVFQ